jgi:glycosyltransferase involved in cell wall biosynthesis
MRILLIGEYSRLHNSLKEGLTALGHEVTIVGTGDDFKKYSVDYSIYPKTIAGNKLFTKLKNGIAKITGIDIEKAEKGLRFKRLLPHLKGYDHVQLINSDALETFPSLSIWLYKKLFRQNKTASLLICGDETPVIEYYLKDELKYSVLSPYLADKTLKPQYQYSLKYITGPYKKLFRWVQQHSRIVITSDMDYKIPMDRMGYETTFIPNPINTDKLTFSPLDITGKIIIFLGINRHSYHKKGLQFFEEALQSVKSKYPDKVEIIVSENMPYEQYIKLYQKAHIVLDQVYGYDQGYNALEAMAAGKVVFTAAEAEFTEHYRLTERVAVNALPDTQSIISELEYFFENPEGIKAIGERARAFIEEEHNYIKIAERYLEVWKK